MKQNLAMRVLSDIMQWDDEQARTEFGWLQLMSDFKYDSYQDYIAGVRFVESLADWLQQFDAHERADAYSFIRHSLVFFSAAEIQHLVELFYPATVEPRLVEALAACLGVPSYRVWSHRDAIQEYKRLRRRSLFLGLSDGARIDVFRRANSGTVSNEQVVLATEINPQKWERMLEDLQKELRDERVRFAFVFLVDDFMGTGKTLLRKEDGKWKGRLRRFWEGVENSAETLFEPDVVLNVHHYITTEEAKQRIPERHQEMLSEVGSEKWFRNVEFTYGLTLSCQLCVSEATQPHFFQLIQKYYDRSIETRHTKVGGDDVRLGFGKSALPLVLEHNTPNNSIALLWAETDGEQGTPMRPLFRRRQRHSG